MPRTDGKTGDGERRQGVGWQKCPAREGRTGDLKQKPGAREQITQLFFPVMAVAHGRRGVATGFSGSI